MGEKGARIGMRLDQSATEAYNNLQQGLGQIIVGSAPDQAVFDDSLKKRREQFESLADKILPSSPPSFTCLSTFIIILNTSSLPSPEDPQKKKMPPIPITILTGFLGSGKTTLLLNLLPQLPKNYKLALLKNEFGDLAIDSQLASTSAISGVRELLNGCICCNLVGQLSDALQQLRDEVQPDRIVIETSGSAFPATLAMEVNRLARESASASQSGAGAGNGTGDYVLDGVISVIDVENWAGYEDTSYTAKIQAKYTDLIVFNKWENVSERRLDEVLDRVGDLEVETATVKSDRGRVEKDVLLGIDGALFAKGEGENEFTDGKNGHGHENGHEHSHGKGHQSEVEVLSVTLRQTQTGTGSETGTIDITALETLLSSAPKEEVYRIKGVLRCSTSSPPASSSDNLDARPSPTASSESDSAVAYYILNWAFGRWTATPSAVVAEAADPTAIARITLILARYESGKWKKKLEGGGLVKSESKGEGGVGAELVVERLV
ncbi:GTP-binding protein [Aspergillus undulatus]|uniref:GTP-binding protein n=1 Tax=Aspergillus undulatus TaxID=1810928 RepID=UPI003CCD88D6